MQRVNPGKPGYYIFQYEFPSDITHKIIFINMQYDKPAHDKKKINHQITFLKKHGLVKPAQTVQWPFQNEIWQQARQQFPSKWRSLINILP